MTSLFERWASLGIYVTGEINPLEDPEALIWETIRHIHEEGRYVGFIASWLSKYGHLLLSKKLRFETEREKRIFSALIEESGTKEQKLLNLVQRPTKNSYGFLFSDLVPILKEITQNDPNPRFLKQGILLKRYPLVRDKIILPANAVFERNAILRNRALYGASLRSDVATVLPHSGDVSVNRFSQVLNVSSQALMPIIRDLEQSGLVEWIRKGRYSVLRWMDPKLSRVA